LIRVSPPNVLSWGDRTFTCALGRAGVTEEKWEGDGATPVGTYPLRQVLYRPDRGPEPNTELPVRPLSPTDGWCDDPEHASYNLRVDLPIAASHERLWRDDSLYDIIVILGHNDDPVVPYRGSAIFMHVAKPDYEPTEGCVALQVEDLRAVLDTCKPGDLIRIDAT